MEAPAGGTPSRPPSPQKRHASRTHPEAVNRYGDYSANDRESSPERVTGAATAPQPRLGFMQLRAGAPPQRIETTVSTMANVLQNVGVDSARRTQAMSIDELVTPGRGGTAVEREVPEKGGSHLNRGSIYRGNVRAPSNAFPCLFHRVTGDPSQAEGRISRAIESELPVYARRVRLHLMFVGFGGFC